MAILHSQAREIVRAAYRSLFKSEPSEGEVDFATAVAFFETLYGRAAGQFARMAADGAFNWGALQGGGAPENDRRFQRFLSLGLHPAKRPGEDASRPVSFYVFPTDEEAAVALLDVWGSADTLAAASSGDPTAVAVAMKRHGYYEGFHVPNGNPAGKPIPPFVESGTAAEAEALNVRDYAGALARNVGVVRGPGSVAGPDPAPLGAQPSSAPNPGLLSGVTLPRVLFAGLAAGLGYWALTRTARGRAFAAETRRQARPLTAEGARLLEQARRGGRRLLKA